ncbi:SH3 domain-containing protein [Romboutsia sp.]|uniref:SH3 domain-containing protein n=1 Tax=Romboutsia sp. TaxID=1965302 RepID=UPI002C52E862|nr:SH3 domain-containing protein [Romboutsia sp.]HSQ90423.1 SH3 domain-containing protein [Romboutsia sp.]
MKNLKKLSLCSIGATALTLGSILPSYAQTLQAETLQNLNLRTGPSTNHYIVLTIKKGSMVEVLENSDIWSIVKYKGTVGYVSSQYLKKISSNNEPPNDEGNNNTTTLMECNVDILNVRRGPSTSDKIVGKIGKTDRVYVIYQTSHGWSRIKYGSGYGYVSSDYLIKVNSNSNPTPSTAVTMQCNTSSLNIRKGPSTSEKIVGRLKYADKVSVVANLSNGWSKIKFNGGYAYVSSQYLSNAVLMPDVHNFMKCNTDVLNVRSGPSTSERLVGNLQKGDNVEVVYHLNSRWSRIKFNDGYAYVSSSYLTNL